MGLGCKRPGLPCSTVGLRQRVGKADCIGAQEGVIRAGPEWGRGVPLVRRSETGSISRYSRGSTAGTYQAQMAALAA